MGQRDKETRWDSRDSLEIRACHLILNCAKNIFPRFRHRKLNGYTNLHLQLLQLFCLAQDVVENFY